MSRILTSTEMSSLDVWRDSAQEFQNDIARGPMGEATWDRYKRSEYKYLFDKIKLAIFGNICFCDSTVGSLVRVSCCGPTFLFYKKLDDVNRLVNHIKRKCIERSGWNNHVYMAIIFVCVRYKEIELITPVFRVCEDDDYRISQNCVIDAFGRVYETWPDYLRDNTWDESWLLYPRGAQYRLDSDEACKTVLKNQSQRGKIVNMVDKIARVWSTTSKATSVGGLVLTLNPATAPFGLALTVSSGYVGLPVAVWSAGRGLETLKDRWDHEQMLNPLDLDARRCWIQTVGGVMAVASSGAKALCYRYRYAGRMSDLSERVSRAISGTNNFVSTAAKIHLVTEIAMKRKRTAEDWFNFMHAMLFVCHTVVEEDTARDVVAFGLARESRQRQKQRHHSRQSRQSRHSSIVRRVRRVRRDNRVLRHIVDHDEFFDD